MGSVVKNLPASTEDAKDMGPTPLDWEDALEEETATHSIILPGESHGQRSLAGLQYMGLQRVRHN